MRRRYTPKSHLWNAIRRKCLEDCCEGSTKARKECQAADCPLWTFRYGVRGGAREEN